MRAWGGSHRVYSGGTTRVPGIRGADHCSGRFKAGRASATRRRAWSPLPSTRASSRPAVGPAVGPALGAARGLVRHARGRPHLGRDRRPALRAGLPPRDAADRQPPRRRGPHPGGLRPGLPQSFDLHPWHLRGLDPPDHHQPLPRPGPPQAADPLRRALRRAGGPAPQRPSRPRLGLRRPDLRRRHRARPGHLAAGVPCGGRPLRRGGSVLRGDRADPRRQARHRPLPDPPWPRHAARGARPPGTGPGTDPLPGAEEPARHPGPPQGSTS